MVEETKEKWIMPEWMEPYRDDIVNTGGNPIEELMNDRHTNAFSNYVRAGLIGCVISQVALLEKLHRTGRLNLSPPCPADIPDCEDSHGGADCDDCQSYGKEDEE